MMAPRPALPDYGLIWALLQRACTVLLAIFGMQIAGFHRLQTGDLPLLKALPSPHAQPLFSPSKV